MSTLYFFKDTYAQKHPDLKRGLGRARLATALRTRAIIGLGRGFFFPERKIIHNLKTSRGAGLFAGPHLLESVKPTVNSTAIWGLLWYQLVMILPAVKNDLVCVGVSCGRATLLWEARGIANRNLI